MRQFLVVSVFMISAILVSGMQSSDSRNTTWHWEAEKELASGLGVKGRWRQNESHFNYVDDPTVAVGGNDEVLVAWVEQDKKDVYFQRFSADTSEALAAPLNISNSPQIFSWLPRISVSPDAPHHIFVVWQEIIFSGGSHGGDIFIARSTDGGRNFSSPKNLSNSIGGAGKGRINPDVWANGSFDIAAGPEGRVIVCWTEHNGSLWMISSTNHGRAFSEPRKIGGQSDGMPVRAPSLAFGKEKTIYLAWTSGDDPKANIMLQKSLDGGRNFASPQPINKGPTHSDAPKLAVASDGIVHLVYAESEAGPFDRYEIRYTQSLDAAKTFLEPRTISAPTPDDIVSSHYPHLSLSSDNKLVILWELYPDHRQNPRGLGITLSHDGGKEFVPAIRVPGSADPTGGTNGSHQGRLMRKLAIQADGTLLIVNSSLEVNEKSRVWLMRGRLNP
jgi:hypothetical protein